MKKLYMIGLILCVALTGFNVQAQNKQIQKALQFEAVKKLFYSGNFMIDITYATPSGGQGVSLFSNRGDLRVKNDSVNAYIPYFGKSYSSAYGDESGAVEFRNQKFVASDAKINEKKKQIIWKFEPTERNNKYQFTVFISSSGSCSITVISSNKSQISYTGALMPLNTK